MPIMRSMISLQLWFGIGVSNVNLVKLVRRTVDRTILHLRRRPKLIVIYVRLVA